MFLVARKKDEVIIESSGGNKDIRIADKLASLTQITTNAPKALHDGTIEGKYVYRAQELTKYCFAALRIATIVNPFVDFSQGDEANSNTILPHSRKK